MMTSIPTPEIARIINNSYYDERVALLLLPSSYPSHSVAFVDTVNDTIELSAAFSFTEGSPLRIVAPSGSGGVAPSPTVDQGIYYATNISGNTFQIAETAAKAYNYEFIDLTSVGSNFTIEEVAPGNGSVADAVRYELAAVNGYQRFYGVQGEAVATATNAATPGYVAAWSFSGAVSFNAILIINNGSPAVGDTYGNLSHIEVLSPTETLGNGDVYTRFIKVIGYPYTP